jgi:DNA-binding transcriptional LysR family regulator
MNFRQLRTFITIADAGGFARAEGRLHLSQPAASRQIQALEMELGVPLFNRIGRRIQLTSEGEDLLRRGRRLLQEADSFGDRARALKGGQAGTLRVDLVEDGGTRIPTRYVTILLKKLVVLAVCCEPVSRANSLLTGKITGNIVEFDRFTKIDKAITR